MGHPLLKNDEEEPEAESPNSNRAAVSASCALPQPAYRVQSVGVFQPVDHLAYATISAAMIAAVFIFVSHWLQLGGWSESPISFSLLMLLFVFSVLVQVYRWAILPLMRRPIHHAPQPGLRVGVATSFVPSLESFEMLEATVRALVAMDYEHDSWVLDEGDDDRVKEMCRRVGAKHFSRKNCPQYQTKEGTFASKTKHGNYNAWLDAEGYRAYDIIVYFDPDHVPRRDYLMRTLGYFEDPAIGYVQPAQVYYNQKASFIARGAAEETYAYYSSIEMSAYAAGYPIVVGCHTALRKTALQQVGGLAPHDADDMLITLYFRTTGWKGVYVPEVLARGLTPIDWPGYLAQQRRWARSVIDLKIRHLPKRAHLLPRGERILTYMHGLYYFSPISSIVAAGTLAYIVATGKYPPILSFSQIHMFGWVILAFMMGDFYRQKFFLDRKTEWGLHLRSGFLQQVKWPFLLAALAEAIVNKRFPFVVTVKRSGMKKKGLYAMWPHFVIAGVLAVAWVIGETTWGITEASIRGWLCLLFAMTGIAMASEFIRFPEPFDAQLLSDWTREAESRTSPHEDEPVKWEEISTSNG